MTKQLIATIELLYICDDEFKSDIKSLRKKYGFKNISLNHQNAVNFDQRLINEEELSVKYDKDIKNICEFYSLEGSENDLEMFIEAGCVPGSYQSLETNFSNSKFCNLKVLPASFKNGKSEIPGSPLFVRFKIRRPIKIGELQDWFNDQSGEIVTMVNDHFKTAKTVVTKLDKLERLIKIIHLKDNMKMTYREIVDHLFKEYDDDPNATKGITEQSVKMLYNRYRRKKKSNTD